MSTHTTAKNVTESGMTIDRRRFLERLGGGVAAGALAPLVPLMDREAQAQGYPLRFVVVMMGAGNCAMDEWRPQSSGGKLGALGEVLGPLEGFRDGLIVVEGVENRAAHDLTAKNELTNHLAGHVCALTGAQPPDAFNNPAEGGGISVDRMIADSANFKGKTPLSSLYLGTTPFSVISFIGPGQPNTMVVDPRQALAKLFPASFKPPAATSPADAEKAAKERTERNAAYDRILAYAVGDTARAKNLAGTEGWQKIDKYRSSLESALKSMKELEDRIAPAGCEKPNLASLHPKEIGALGTGNIDPLEHYVPLGRLNYRLAAAAFACDMTRVAVLQWGAGGGGGKVPDLLPGGVGVAASSAGINGFHQLGHYTQAFYRHGPIHPKTGLPTLLPGMEHYPALKRELIKFYAKELATFLGYLKNTREGSGSVLDNTVVLWTNGMAWGGHFYTAPGLPNVIYAGSNVLPSARRGTYHLHRGKEQSQLMASLCQMMKLNVTTFGAPQYGSGGALAGLV